uniref:Putative glycosyl hydrolase family5 n=1 Tax=Coptotermes formosanus TaxID=36987 RepID=R4V127_COPFO|nr:putative glycosyl hydrolase family5 [Coptotermes formosanus]
MLSILFALSSSAPLIPAVRGVSLFWHQWGSGFYTEYSVKQAISVFNVGIIRAAIGVENDDGALLNPTGAFNNLTNAIDPILAAGIWGIVDWHQHQIHAQEAIDFFTKVVDKYKSGNIIYELYNEPAGPSWSEVKQYALQVIPIIRAANPTGIILVGTPQWDQKPGDAAASPIDDKYVVYALHFYAGTHKQWLRDDADKAIATGIQLFVSECGGMDASGDGGMGENEWKLWVQWMANNQIGWAVWSLNNKDETASLLKPTTNPASWTASDLTSWGTIVKNSI